MNHVNALRAQSAPPAAGGTDFGGARACIYIFLSGGLAQHESFDLKPHAPDTIRGEFSPVATQTPGIQICEHLPMLAARSEKWSVVRSLTHGSNAHSLGHHIMLTGRSTAPPAFSGTRPQPTDYPSIAAVAGDAIQSRNNLPPAAVLPEKLVHYSRRIIPGQFAGQMGEHRDPWFIEASPFHNTSYGAYPEYAFDHQRRGKADNRLFQAPNLSLSHGVTQGAFSSRISLLGELESQRRYLDRHASIGGFDRYREGAISLLSDPKVKHAFDVTNADVKTQEKYGKNSFGWSLLMARRMVEAGVSLVQVNLGNDETWDTHGNAFPHLREHLLPPTDRAVSALLDDLEESGMLDSTLIVMAGEFGRTPRISLLSRYYEFPGRDHWGAVQSVFFAGGGTNGGTVIGSSDKDGAYPADNPQTPEGMAATIYRSLNIPQTGVWKDALGRPHHIYHGEPIAGLI